MAFKFRSKSSLPTTNKFTVGQQQASGGGGGVVDGSSGGGGEILPAGGEVLPKFTNAQLNKLTKEYPSWLKDKSGPKQLPGIYQGVLGQVQLQPGIPGFDGNHQMLTNGQKLLLANKLQLQQQIDYMNRFTDTERVHQLLSASQLSNETLATIWAHVNQTFPGRLTNREVCLALALIAIFQRFGEDDGELRAGSQALKKDPFGLVKAERKPPVPVLYPAKSQQASRHLPHQTITPSQISSSKSTPDKLSGSASSGALLVDFGDNGDDRQCNMNNDVPRLQNKPATEASLCDSQKSKPTISPQMTCQLATTSNPLNLIDMLDGDMFEIEFFKLTRVWLKLLSAMRTIFKRSFDILNVENSRQSAIEALKSEQGKQFSRHLCLCYPIAHNIKFKIDQLNKVGASRLMMSGDEQEDDAPSSMISSGQHQANELFDKNYVTKIDDLMNSVNEYWAVLINLFHESGQTKFIELIMDGLNYKSPTVFSRTIGELSGELNGFGKPNVCSICHTNFYLATTSIEPSQDDDWELISGGGEQVELISDDNQYYYHARCANFWLNNVDSTGLPSSKRSNDDNILSPAAANFP